MWDCTPVVEVRHTLYSSKGLITAKTYRLSGRLEFEHYYTLCPIIQQFYFDLGDITIMGDEVLFDSNQLTLTCISIDGPATNATWTRDSVTVTEGTETVLDDPETAQYTHTLTVTTGGEYTCTVENNKPSSDSATTTLSGIIVDCKS